MITYISRERLEPHPDNPRKDLGDLTELVASITKQGLLQNLTVVPHPEKDGMYRILIGHRRYAAAGLAGMKEMPCVIEEHMPHAEQIAVMMSENIQRNDLTITEKVGGVQMMMDLGLNALDVAQKTGISSSTVYRYAKLAQLNRAEMIKAEQRGATLMQFAEINDIEDEQLRKEALDKVGTRDYGTVMACVRREREKAAVLPKLREVLREYGAKEIEKQNYNRHAFDTDYAWSFAGAEEALRNHLKKRKKEIEYVVQTWGITLYTVMKEDPNADAKAEAKRLASEKLAARYNEGRELARRYAAKRDEFVRRVDVSGKVGKDEVMRFVLWQQTRTEFQNAIMIGGLLSEEVFKVRPEEPNYTGSLKVGVDDILILNEKQLVRALFMGTYERLGHRETTLIDRWTGEYKPDDTLIGMYAYLQDMGYELDDEEMDWLDGTHRIYQGE